MVVKDYLANIIFDLAKDRITDKIAEAKVRKRIADFLDRQQSLNNFVSFDEEIDFEAFADYIRTDLIDDVKLRCYGSLMERRAAHKRIINKARSYASAHTKLSEKRAIKIVNTAVEIIAKYYRSKTNRDLLFVAGTIEDTIIEDNEKTRSQLSQGVEEIKSELRETALLSIDRDIQSARSGQLPEVENKLGMYLNVLSAGHTLFPDFGFRMNSDNKLISVPLNDSARQKYPENLEITPSAVRIGNQSIETIDKSVLDWAYRHQLPISIDVLNAKKYLGDVLDPIQSEAEELIGGQAIMKPPAFPPAFPCNVCIDSEIVVPYLLLRTKEIFDDGSVLITNEEQNNFNFNVSIIITPSTKSMTLSVKPTEPSNREYLSYRIILRKATEGNTLSINALDLNEYIVKTNINKTDTETWNIEQLDSEIEFLTKIVDIEKYFNTSIVIPDSLTIEDHLTINRVYNLIHGGFNGHTAKFDFTLDLTEEVQTRILEMEDCDYVLVYSFERNFAIFGHEFVLPIVSEVDCVKIDDFCRLKEKATILQFGEPIVVSVIPGMDNTSCSYFDKIKTDENLSQGVYFFKSSDIKKQEE